VQFNSLLVHKYASTDPTAAIGSEETPYESGYSLGGIAETWVWSNFTWSNPKILPGTKVAWKISYVDTSGNWNSTNEMIFTVGSQGPVTWWDSSWLHRKGITITDNSGSALSGFQVKLNVAYVPSKMKPDFSDLRFIGGDQTTMLPYWIESYTPSSSSSVWVKVPAIPASGTTTIYMYYGNPSASYIDSGSATMEFFDAFTGSSLDTTKWNVNAVNQITYSVNDYFTITGATASSNTYWVYDGTDTGSQHQAKWTPLSQFVIEFKSAFSDSSVAEMGEGMIGLVAADNTVIGAAGYSDWSGTDILPWRGTVTENLASSMGASVALNPWFPNAAYKTVSTTDATHWTVEYDGSTLKFYDDGAFFAQSSVSSPVAKLAIIGGAYYSNPYLDYTQFNGLFVHKYATQNPTATIGPEETP
jgi:hypothetical protein